MHLDAALRVVPIGAVCERAKVEIGAGFAVQTHQQIRLNAAVTPCASSYAGSRIAGSLRRSTPTRNRESPTQRLCAPAAGSGVASGGSRLPMVEPGKNPSRGSAAPPPASAGDVHEVGRPVDTRRRSGRAVAQPRAHLLELPAPRRRSAHRRGMQDPRHVAPAGTRPSPRRSRRIPPAPPAPRTSAATRGATSRKQRTFGARQVIFRQFGDLLEQPAACLIVEQLRRQRLLRLQQAGQRRIRDTASPPGSGRSHQASIGFPVRRRAPGERH